MSWLCVCCGKKEKKITDESQLKISLNKVASEKLLKSNPNEGSSEQFLSENRRVMTS
jgi:hypothetical protein